MYIPERAEYKATLKGSTRLTSSASPHSVGTRQTAGLIESVPVTNSTALEKLQEGEIGTVCNSVQVYLDIRQLGLNKLNVFNEDQVGIGDAKGLGFTGNHRDFLQKPRPSQTSCMFLESHLISGHASAVCKPRAKIKL